MACKIMSQVADKAYRELKSRIQGGQFQPGQRLVERSLCDELGMSRTPVREALKILTTEGLVTTRPRRGMVVSELSEEEVDEIFEFGLVLEAFIASLAAKKAGEKQLKELKYILNNMKTLLSSDDPDKSHYIELDRQFHVQIAVSAANERLARMLRQTMDNRVLHQTFSHYRAQDCEVSLLQHQTILRAIESGDREWASSAMRTHILTGRSAGHSSENR
jgi:DNA-binding GntR family transcriptional regulator